MAAAAWSLEHQLGSPPPQHVLLSRYDLGHRPPGPLPDPPGAVWSPRGWWGLKLRQSQGEPQSKEKKPDVPSPLTQWTPSLEGAQRNTYPGHFLQLYCSPWPLLISLAPHSWYAVGFAMSDHVCFKSSVLISPSYHDLCLHFLQQRKTPAQVPGPTVS